MTDTRLFEARPGIGIVLLPDAPRFTIHAASRDFLESRGLAKAEAVGRGYFELFPAAAAIGLEAHMTASFARVLSEKSSHQIPFCPFPAASREENKNTCKVFNVPVIDNKGEVEYIVQTIEEINTPAAEKAKDGLERAYSLFMNAPVIIGVLKGDDYIIELANEGLLEVWGRTADVIGKPLLKALPELQAQGLIALLEEVRSTGQPFYAYEFPITFEKFGRQETRYFDFVYKPLYEEGGGTKASGIFSVGHDVTPQVKALTEVKESESKYRNLFESMDQGFCVLEMIFDDKGKPLDYRFMETNPVFEKQTGLKNAKGKTALELVPGLESHWLELYGKVVRTGEAVRFTEGSEAMGRWFEVYAFPFGGAGSHKVALLFTDISERRKAEEAVRQSERNLRNIILQAPVAMCILRGRNFVIEVANTRMFELWGIDAEGVLGKPLFEAVSEARNEGYEELLTHVLTTGQAQQGMERPASLPRKGKTGTVYVNFSFEPIRDLDGSINSVMAMATEVTEQVLARRKIEELVALRTYELEMANEALSRTNRELARSNQNLEEFAYAASHDLKEPMRKIQLFSDRIRNRLQDKLFPEDRIYFEKITQATGRMNTLIDDLLTYSHVSRGGMLEEMVDLNQKLAIVLEDLDLAIAEKKASITIGPLPVVRGHRRQLQQLFLNLVGNAIKYSKQDVPPEVKVKASLVDTSDDSLPIPNEMKYRPYHLIEVQDNGIGFDPVEAERIF
ncbi:MAG TPA: PAS domain-containing protein, partial [Flavisolibacter sp.]|nr:PAS domain-containing protein [Flavisolibacter sp.]